MQKLIDKITTQVEGFIEQRRNLVMLLSCTDNEAGMVLKIIQDIERASPSDAYFFFDDDFSDLADYADTTVQKLYSQHELANQEADREGLELLTPPPQELTGQQLTPAQKLGKAMVYTRSLVPEIGTHNVIWVLCPLTIHNRAEYHQLVASFTPKKGIHDGMQGLRIIFRDLPESRDFSPQLAELPAIQFNQVDMGPEAINNSLEESIDDESLPDDERFGAMLQKAMIDSAHGRYNRAYSALKYMLGYFQHTKNYSSQAVTIIAAGDIYFRKDEFDNASRVYETAIEPAVKSKSATVLHNVVSNLADSEFNRSDFPLAEKYYGQADELASKMLFADGKIRALNQQAECAVQQDSWDRAIEYWERAADFCRNGEYEEDLVFELEKLLEAKKYLEPDRQDDYERELNDLQGGG